MQPAKRDMKNGSSREMNEMEKNPYQSPVPDGNHQQSRNANWLRPWLPWAAFGWFVYLFVRVPSFNIIRTPPGAFLGYKIVTTIISMIACISLICVPHGLWKALTIPLAVLLVLVEIVVWGLP